MPSAWGAFTSACCLRSVRMAARSGFSAASASRASLAKPTIGWSRPAATASATDRSTLVAAEVTRLNFFSLLTETLEPRYLGCYEVGLHTVSNGQRLKQLIHLSRAVGEFVEVD